MLFLICDDFPSVIGPTRVAFFLVRTIPAVGPSSRGLQHVSTSYELVSEPIGSSFPKEATANDMVELGCSQLANQLTKENQR